MIHRQCHACHELRCRVSAMHELTAMHSLIPVAGATILHLEFNSFNQTVRLCLSGTYFARCTWQTDKGWCIT
jgi:hypothetical protein